MTDFSDFPTAPTDPDAALSGADWRDDLPDALRARAEKFAAPADLLKSYVELERRLGRSVVVPGAGADDDERARFYGRLGRPDAPGDYAVSLPDDLPEHLRPDEAGQALQSSFLDAMHKAGASPEIVQSAIDWYYGTLRDADTDAGQFVERSQADSEAAMRREWGGAYDDNVAYARRALQQYGGDDLVALLDQTGLGNNAALLRAFARVGQTTGEDRPQTGTAGGGKSLKEELDDLRGRPDYWRSDAIQRRVREINVALHGTRPIHATGTGDRRG